MGDNQILVIPQGTGGGGGGGAVDSFNGRTGAVVSQSSDYDAYYYTKAIADGTFIKRDGSSAATTGLIKMGVGQGLGLADNSALAIFTSNQVSLQANNSIEFYSLLGTYNFKSSTGNIGAFNFQALTTARNIVWQDKAYTGVADLSDVTGVYMPLSGGTFTGNVNGVTPTQLTYLNSLSSNVQTQLNGKQAAFTAQASNLVYSGPASGGSAAPTFRSLVAADVPFLASGYVPYTGANANADLGTYTLSAGALQGGALYDTGSYLQMVGFGDSTMVGQKSTNNSAYSWVALFANGIGTTLVNKAIVGTTMVKFSNGDNSMIDRIAEIPLKTAAIKCIVFDYGINDAIGGFGPFNAANFQAACEQVCDQCITNGFSPADIIFITPPYCNVFVGNPTVKNIILGLNASKGVTVIDVQQAMINNGGLSLVNADGVHPTNAGHRVAYNACIAANYSTFTPFSTFNSSVAISGNLSIGNRLYGGGLTTDGLIIESAPIVSNFQKRITIVNDTYFKGNIIVGPDLSGAITSPAYIDLGASFANSTTPSNSNLKIKLLNNNTGIGVDGTNGVLIQSSIGGATGLAGSRITSMQNHFFNGNLLIQPTLTGAVANVPYIELGNQYSSNTGTLTYSQLSIRGLGAFGGGGIGLSTTDGLVLFGNFGAVRVTSYHPFYTKGIISSASNLTLGTSQTGAVATPAFIDLGASFANATTTGSTLKVKVWTGTGLGADATKGLSLLSNIGVGGRITSMSDHYFDGVNSTAGNVILGTSLTGSQTTPSYLDLGTSYSATAATNLKVRIWTNTGLTFSAGSFDYVVDAGLAHKWYQGTTNHMTLSSTGLLTLAGGATLGGKLSLAAGTTSNAPIVFLSGTNVTTLVPGAIEYDGTNFLMTATTGRFKVAMSAATTTGYIPYWKSDGSLDSDASFAFSTTNGLSIGTAGQGLRIKSGSNARIGSSVLVGGTVTVSNTSVTANTLVFPVGVGTTNSGYLAYTVNAGVGFTVTSSNPLDTRTVTWVLIESI